MVKKIKILIILLLCSLNANAEICNHNPIAEGFKFDNGVLKIHLDKRYSNPNIDNTLFFSHRSVIQEAVTDLNKFLNNIQLELVDTDEDFSLQGQFNRCEDHPNTFDCVNSLQADMRFDYKNSIALTVGSNSGSAGVFCSNGEDVKDNPNCVQNIKFSLVSLGANNSNNYDRSTQVDIARHEIMHGLGLPHVFGPYQIGEEAVPEGSIWFDTVAVATPVQGASWKKFLVPNMDPIINTTSHGLKGTDIQNLQDKYGKDSNKRTLKVSLVQDNGEVVRAMNVALQHVRRHHIKSVARSTYDGVAFLTTTKGRYFIQVRPMGNADLGNKSSGVEGERKPFFYPTSTEYTYVCKRNKRTKVYKLCKNPKKKKLFKLKKDTEITILVEADQEQGGI